MKLIRLLVAMYVLFLSVYPCSDDKTCADERKVGIYLSENSNHNHTASEQDSCTPFCICACCAASIQLSYSMIVSNDNPQHNTKLNTTYFERPLLINAKSIWQPPKIS